ncbi:MAG: DEAD/DEAH box helicase [Candidatus Nanohaloarchaeota archaeon QJJ-5]|nr:DEAD/DEAH box helicase [Candidatus Nanohaloarchaeota archaeon QJJ-5]
MKTDDITEVPAWLRETLIEKGITDLNPPQEQAIENGLFDGDSLIVSSPTASGKTLIATLGIAQSLEAGDKALYLVPLKALASEKYEDYKELFGDHYDIGISVGDRDSGGQRLADKDLIIMTVEKLDAILRHSPTWIKDVDLVVEDEIHLLNSENRGPTLEVTLTRLRDIIEFQLIGLSATITNDQQLADWLDATLVSSDYRPVDLKEGICWSNRIEYYLNTDAVDPPDEQTTPQETPVFKTGKDKLEEEKQDDELETETQQLADEHGKDTLNILHDTFNRDKQAITFVRSRKSAEAEAEKAGSVAKPRLSREQQQELHDVADRIESVLGSPTEQCKRLAGCVRDGTAFHHAGLLSEQRSLIEEQFRKGNIQAIAATPTLAAGVSLPAYRIIIRDVKRYTNAGLTFIPVLEYRQMAGRAGRPEHHDEGQAIAVANGEGMKQDIRDRYILGESEQIYSKLAVEPVLRMHTLSLIATRFVGDFDGLLSFFADTFYAHQYGDISEIESKLESLVDDLDEYGFITAEDKQLRPTPIGKRVAELYIDPESAHNMLDALETSRGSDQGRSSLALLQLLCEQVEMKPLLRVKDDEELDLEDIVQTAAEEFLTDVPKPWDGHQYESFLNSVKTAMMLNAWIEEKEEDEMMEKYGVTPGGIRAKVENADWLLYGCEEIARMKDWQDIESDLSKLRTRLKHGIKEELVSLVKFKQIGRVRARKLFDQDITTASDIRDTEFTQLKKLIGKTTAKKLKEQVGQDEVFDKENVLDYLRDD